MVNTTETNIPWNDIGPPTVSNFNFHRLGKQYPWATLITHDNIVKATPQIQLWIKMNIIDENWIDINEHTCTILLFKNKNDFLQFKIAWAEYLTNLEEIIRK